MSAEQIAQRNEHNDQVLHGFWTHLMSVLDAAPDRSMLQDVIVTNLQVAMHELPEAWIHTEQRVRHRTSSR